MTEIDWNDWNEIFATVFVPYYAWILDLHYKWKRPISKLAWIHHEEGWRDTTKHPKPTQWQCCRAKRKKKQFATNLPIVDTSFCRFLQNSTKFWRIQTIDLQPHASHESRPNVCSTLNTHLWKTQATRLKVCKRNSRKAATAMRKLNHGPNVYDLQWICTQSDILTETKHKSVGSKQSWQICKVNGFDCEVFSVMEGWPYSGQPKTIAKSKQVNYIKHCTNSVLKKNTFRIPYISTSQTKQRKKSTLRRWKWTCTTVPFCVIGFKLDTMDQNDTHQNLCKTCAHAKAQMNQSLFNTHAVTLRKFNTLSAIYTWKQCCLNKKMHFLHNLGLKFDSGGLNKT